MSSLLIAGGLLVDELSVRRADLLALVDLERAVVWQDGTARVGAGFGRLVTR